MFLLHLERCLKSSTTVGATTDTI